MSRATREQTKKVVASLPAALHDMSLCIASDKAERSTVTVDEMHETTCGATRRNVGGVVDWMESMPRLCCLLVSMEHETGPRSGRGITAAYTILISIYNYYCRRDGQ